MPQVTSVPGSMNRVMSLRLNAREQTKYKMFRFKGTARADLVTFTGQVADHNQFEFFMYVQSHVQYTNLNIQHTPVKQAFQQDSE